MLKIKNPILKGFNPDPSICKAEDNYYIATSTFEWFPGVQIHHSKDLVNWELIAHPLNRVSQLNILGTPDSGGIWAPCLSYDNGIFYLIYTIVNNNGHIKDTHNYLVTSSDICGEWSEPVYLNSSAFDPSLFHDDDGKKWIINMKWDNRIGKNNFAGHLLQEYDEKNKCLTGPVMNIFKGTDLGCSEGPHIYKHNDYYYLMAAEGGTSYEHAVTLARSRKLTGPYEVHPQNPILTSVGSDMHKVLQKAGHASIVEGPNNEWFMVHLCGRPLPETDRCILGRETAIQKVEWREDNWLYLCSDTDNLPSWEIEINNDSESESNNEEDVLVSQYDDFNNTLLNINFQSLRVPAETFMSLTERPGFLRLYGKESMFSKFTQSMIARRQQNFVYSAETCVEFEPETTLQLAGLICYYNTENYHYLRISMDEELGGKCIGVLASINNDLSESMTQDDNILITDVERIYLKVEVNFRQLRFFFATNKNEWRPIGKVYDASTLSDDAIKGSWAFTGAFVGIACQDLSGMNKHADFDYFSYVEGI
ncbi:glycoside hydrolase family 43 protein [Clostridium beijerinckii]|uniref:glycoside hydrolase family 43 protein n=1 Tax=Clostridium beijerinckii TaxID=1520 RepID=UPI00098C1B1A|nr:glycoside hydrolase family 43 protein [Clostridium beijerinckii]MBA8932248.1 xylan 1,4-beta-xylosidase [Clostridium beijerinckii]NRU36452.1 xylan 1,4-beta-xylosidase [Clostridium beijerinckii]NSB00269.1 xylan 1,4-beta-xylosidase [Clostridium beijerinckii]OOM56295.1 beta-xylosidase [Clostridium beijerinckii]OOM66756.1 beta-xylosidase [Clostridium beijerinckii]